MDRSTVIGFFGGFALIYVAIALQGDLTLFLSSSSFLIVNGGLLAASIVNFSIGEVNNTFSLLFKILSAPEHDLRTDIELMNMFSRRARRDGLLRIENDIRDVESEFLRNGLQLAIDGTEKRTLITILQYQLESSRRNLNKSVDVLMSMAGYAPAFGMIGTIIGLVLMLQNIEDPSSLGAGLSVALLTTLYGTVFANMVFKPLAGKLDHLGDRQIVRKQMFMSSIISIVDEENPRLMENKMLNYVSPEERSEYRKYFQEKSFNKEREEKLYEIWSKYQSNPWQDLLKILETG